MNSQLDAAIRVRVDPTNPGQFFACCGLLELADRLWGAAEGWFEDRSFHIRPQGATSSTAATLGGLLTEIAKVPLRQIDPDDDYSSPVEMQRPFELRLNWWKDDRAGGNRLKVWAGSMRSVRIAAAMQNALRNSLLHKESLFDSAMIVYDPVESDKKVEPFYFDSRRGANAQALDIGFAPDSLQMTTAAYPAVEFLCLVGLQRFRPMSTARPRVFDYFLWPTPLPVHVASTAACGLLPYANSSGFRFENAFRTSQRKHKAFNPATQFERS